MTINNTTKAITPISMLGTMLSKLRPRLEPTEFSVLLSSSFSSLFYVLSSRSRNPKSNKTLTVEFVEFILFDVVCFFHFNFCFIIIFCILICFLNLLFDFIL